MTSSSVTTRARVVLPPALRSGTVLPAGVQLTTDHPGVDVSAGVLTSRAADAVVVRITVPAAPEVTDTFAGTETFEVTVLPADAPVLLAGTRRPDPDPAVYAPRIAFSLHLALATPDGAVDRLNDDRGVLFPRAVPTEHVDTYRVRTLTDPWILTHPGGYAVVASPALPDGSPELSASSAVLLFQSPDLITYEEVGLVQVAAGGGVRRPGGVYDQARAEFVLWWTDDAGRTWSATAATLDGPWAPSVPTAPVVPTPPAPDGAPSHVLTGALPLREADALRLRRRFGRIRNVAVEVPPIETMTGEVARELPWARLTYDDGSTARRPVDWDPDSLAGVGWDRPGEYVLTGTVRQRVYPFPFVVDRADPTVLAYQGRYYFIATDDPDGNCVAPTRLLIRVAESIAGLATAPDHAIVEVGTADIAGCFWAPEPHLIGGRLHCLFAPSVGAADWKRVRCHVMRLRDGGDPVVAADWEPPRPVLQADGSPLQRDPEHPGLSLDMTYVEDAGRSDRGNVTRGNVTITAADPPIEASRVMHRAGPTGAYRGPADPNRPPAGAVLSADPAGVSAGGTSTVAVTVENVGDEIASDLTVAIAVPDGWRAVRTGPPPRSRLAPGAAQSVSWQVTAPASVSTPVARAAVTATVGFRAGQTRYELTRTRYVTPSTR